MDRRNHIFALASLAVVCACTAAPDANPEKGDEVRTGGTIVISASADADILFPPLAVTIQAKQIDDQIFDVLADIGAGLNTVGDAGFKPRLAKSWSWSPDSLSIVFAIDPAARWHDGVQVSADDVRFTYALVKNPATASVLASSLDDVDSVTTSDSVTARVWFGRRSPAQFYRAAASIPILPAHLLRGTKPSALGASEFGRHPVGSGRFRFERWDQGSAISITADSTNYRGRPRPDRVTWIIAPDYTAASLRFISGGADVLDVVKPEAVAGIRGSKGRLIQSTPGLDYGYVGFNLVDPVNGRAHPIFADRNLRRALVMSVNRAALVQNVFDSLASVAHGPVTRAIPTSDTTIGLPYDTAAAARTLDSLGWKRGPSGIRSRGGVELAFSLMVASSSTARMRLATLLQDQWLRAGASVRIESLELNAYGAKMEAKQFDAILNAWHIDPDPASIREEWTEREIRKGGFNLTSYRNPALDALVDSAATEWVPQRSVELYRRAYRILTEDAAAMWLYEPKNVFGVSDRIRTTGVRPDGWWINLADWSVMRRK
jgi:peptide/nickel transport system substrate-binding protein